MIAPQRPRWLLVATLCVPCLVIVIAAFAVTPILALLLIACLVLAGEMVRRGNRPVRYHLCPACGYDLRAVGGPNCPECGAKVVVSVTGRHKSARQGEEAVR